MPKTLAVLFTTLTLVFLLPAAGLAQGLSLGLLGIGDGGTLTNLAPGVGVWTQMMSVGPVTVPFPATCVVTASFTFNQAVAGGIVQSTLHTVANERGPWVQVHDGGSWESSSMSQAFSVEPGVPTTFYMNGENRGVSNVTTENTRIFVICRPGGTVPTPESAGGGGTGNQ